MKAILSFIFVRFFFYYSPFLYKNIKEEKNDKYLFLGTVNEKKKYIAHTLVSPINDLKGNQPLRQEEKIRFSTEIM